MFLLRGHTDPPIWSSSLIELDPRPVDHTHPTNGDAAVCCPPAVGGLPKPPCQQVTFEQLLGTRILAVDIEVGGRGSP